MHRNLPASPQLKPSSFVKIRRLSLTSEEPLFSFNQNNLLPVLEEGLTSKRTDKRPIAKSSTFELNPLGPPKCSLRKVDSQQVVDVVSKHKLIPPIMSGTLLQRISSNPSSQLKLKICDNVVLLATESGSELKGVSPYKTHHFLYFQDLCKYTKFCDDFGPMSLGTTYEFFKQLENKRKACLKENVILECKLEG